MKAHQWKVHKFGGSSVANAERLKKVATILSKQPEKRLAVVVSAMSGITDHLLHISYLASHQKEGYLEELEKVQARHLEAMAELLPSAQMSYLHEILNQDFLDLREILRGIYLTKDSSHHIQELISGYGETWSAQILDEYLRSRGIKSAYLDARKVLVLKRTDTGFSIDWTKSRKNIKNWLASHSKVNYLVITGFIASDNEGKATTLGRNGSDYSASIFGALLQAPEIVIWTDVDGVMSADPRLVPDAVVLETMSYQEATELAYFGAKVLHPSTMTPAMNSGIPIWIKNTLNPSAPGTCISNSNDISEKVVKGFSVIQNMALVTVEGNGMMGVPGVAQRLFSALSEVKISVVLISQASSEHSICFAVAHGQSLQAKETLHKTFSNELRNGQVSSVSVQGPCTILAAVGDKMVQQPGVSGLFFGALGRAGVNIRAIAQGASERNISAVISKQDTVQALRAVHSAFLLSSQTLSIGILGVGNIGSTLLNQIATETPRLRSEFGIDLRVRAISNSKTMLLGDESLNLNQWKEDFKSAKTSMNVDAFIKHVQVDYLPHSVIVDCTASGPISSKYSEWLEKGLHVVSANKKANADRMQFYKRIRESSKKKNKKFYYTTNVGGGLPIISTLRDLIQTGDEVEELEGVLSGTVSFLFNKFDGSVPFSALVKEAQALGYTEPDPRDDLKGTDVARKLVILAREIGLRSELRDVKLESLADYSDSYMSKMIRSANERGEVPRYVGIIQPKKERLKVGIKMYPKDHRFAQITGSDNIVSFRTARYCIQPLIIQGPGAGPEVTAAGVFADLLRLAHTLGGKL